MLKFEINKDHTELQAMGSMEYTANEILPLIHLVYTRVSRSNPMVADAFKRVLIECLADPASPVFTRHAISGNMADICIVTDHHIHKSGQEGNHET